MIQVSKTSVNYREATGARKCGNCAMMDVKKGTCDLVRGRIEARDTCDKWVAKSGGWKKRPK